MTVQSTNHVLMVRPYAFSSNLETAKTNEFQDPDAQSGLDLHGLAIVQFDAAVKILRDASVDVIVVEDTAEPIKPDAIFPNNWFTTHLDGSFVLYPMQPVSRRFERRSDVITMLQNEHSFEVRRTLDLSDFERTENYLEGTGSLVLDRANKIAYACLSARTDEVVLQEFCHQFDYQAVAFEANGPSGQAIYHTNVMMCVGTGYCVICLDSIASGRAGVEEALQGQQVIPISMEQVEQFAGNMLEVCAVDGERLLVMSRRAESSLSQSQKSAIERHARIVSCDVNVIEDASGGSIRCMMAEVFLPLQR